MKLTIRIQPVGEEANTRSKVVSLNKDYCLVGRSNADIELRNEYCSKEHALFFEDDKGRLCVRDLQSLNGIYYRDRKVQTAILRQGSQLEIAGYRIEVISFSPYEPNLLGRFALKANRGNPFLVPVIINSWPAYASKRARGQLK